MKKIQITFFTVLIFLTALYQSSHAEKKLAQTGFQFLSVVSDARAGGMSEAMTTYLLNSGSLFFNPACMSGMTQMVDVAFSQNKWIADIKHNTFSAAYSPAKGRYGVFGVTFMNVDYGDIQGTMVWGNTQGYIDTEILKPSAYSIGLGYSRALSDKFYVGGQLKYVKQYYGKSVISTEADGYRVKKYVESAFAVDFGTYFKTGFRSVVFGMSIRNFSGDVKLEKEAFQLPLTFKMGLSANAFDFFAQSLKESGHGLLVSIDAAHPRDYPEYINLGGEYAFRQMIFLRSGYILNHSEYNFSFGFGIQYFGINFDYSYTPFKEFDNFQKLTMRFSL